MHYFVLPTIREWTERICAIEGLACMPTNDNNDDNIQSTTSNNGTIQTTILVAN